MPELKSPAKILKLWKKGTADHLKANKAKTLEPQEDFLNKKIVKGLERLRVAATLKAETPPDEFAGMRDETTRVMDKFRKELKPKKDKPTAKPFYQRVCRLILVVEKLELRSLDVDDSDPREDVLDGLDPTTVDRRDDTVAPSKPGVVPAAPPPPPAPPPAQAKTPAPAPANVSDAAAFAARLKEVVKAVLKAQETCPDDVKRRLTLLVKAAQDSARAKKFVKGNDLLDHIEDILKDQRLARLRQAQNTCPPAVKAELAKLMKAAKYFADRGDPASVKEMYARVDKFLEAEAARQAEPIDPALETTAQWASRIDLRSIEWPAGMETLGSGTMGTVSKLSGAAVPLVVKRANGGYEQELQREAEVYKQVGDHPNFARCLGLHPCMGSESLVLEHVQGQNAEKAMTDLRKRYENGELKQEEYWGVMQYTLASTLTALAHLELKGLVHVDIKPDNVMVDQTTGAVKVIDLGTAIERGNPQNRKVAGTAGYRGPGDRTQPSADLFALGSMAFKAGEGKNFDYKGHPKALSDAEAAAADFARPDANNEPKQALDPATASAPASREVDIDTGARKKNPDRYAEETAYTEFVNWLTDPDPAKRPSARKALEHPFMKDRLLGDDAARALMKGLIDPSAQADKALQQVEKVTPLIAAATAAVAQATTGNPTDERLTVLAKALRDARRRLEKTLTMVDGAVDSLRAATAEQDREMRAKLQESQTNLKNELARIRAGLDHIDEALAASAAA
jgi:hypothetical protein